MAARFPIEHPYLSKGFEPIRFECDYADLVVEGQLPPDLNGCLYRIGPNPQYAPRGPYNPLLGDGMIHAFHIGNGRVRYRNRWVRTEQWRREREAGHALFGSSSNPLDADPAVAGISTDGVANTALAWHGGRLLALEEGHAPISIDPESLETLGQWRFDGALPGNMTAHPKIDPENRELIFFANFPQRDFSGRIEIYVANREGTIVSRRSIAGPIPALVHDFAITQNHIIFVLCPVTVSVERARSGSSAIAWEPERGSWIGLMRRDGVSESSWIRTRPFMAWHMMNAFEDGGAVRIDLCQQEAAAFPTATGTSPNPVALRQYLTRWTVPLGTRFGEACEERLCDLTCEYPTIDSRQCGHPYRFGYVACEGGPGTDDLFHRAIGRFDHITRETMVWNAGAQCAVSEPIFVAKPDAAEDGGGYLLAVVYDESRNASHLAVFNAADIGRGPVARAQLDHRVPVGFHGLWLEARSVKEKFDGRGS